MKEEKKYTDREMVEAVITTIIFTAITVIGTCSFWATNLPVNPCP